MAVKKLSMDAIKAHADNRKAEIEQLMKSAGQETPAGSTTMPAKAPEKAPAKKNTNPTEKSGKKPAKALEEKVEKTEKKSVGRPARKEECEHISANISKTVSILAKKICRFKNITLSEYLEALIKADQEANKKEYKKVDELLK